MEPTVANDVKATGNGPIPSIPPVRCYDENVLIKKVIYKDGRLTS